jgi:hypothetical protein
MKGLERISVVVASEQVGEETCEIEYERGCPIALRLHSPSLGEIAVTDEDTFGALCKLRVHLEKEGYLLLCNAARRDAYPSRMSRQMAGGRKVYVLKPGMQGRREDLVDVFEAAPFEKVGTVTEQRLAFEAWLRSLK